MSEPHPSLAAGISGFPNIARLASRGGRLATVVSAFAFAFSGVSFYETVLKQPNLSVFVPPVIHYARDSGGDIELFAIPISIVNDGARSGTVLSIDLEVESLQAASATPVGTATGGDSTAAPVRKRYYSAYFGEHQVKSEDPGRAFAPASIAGRGTFSETVRFYPAGNPLPKLVQDAGDFRFALVLNLADQAGGSGWLDRLLRNPPPPPLRFQMTLPWISDQQLGSRRLAIAMHARDFKPVSTRTEAAK